MTPRATCSLVLLVALGLGPALAFGAGGGAQTPVGSCATIDEPGTYVLTQDVENSGGTPISGACIEITADDVTFDGGDRTIGGRGESHTKAVAVIGAENVTVRNVAASDWHAGVFVTNGSATVRSVQVSGNAYGVQLANATGSEVHNNTVADNLIGVYADAPNVTLADNDLSGNEISIKRADGDGEPDEEDGERADGDERRRPPAQDHRPVPRP